MRRKYGANVNNNWKGITVATHNDITGDALVSRVNNKNFDDNFDRIFRNKKPQEPVQLELDFGDEEAERRMDIIGSNGNIGYEENK
jgi:hypothetical protein